MRYISLFSGIEAASCAWEPLGWKPIAFSEIDKFPSAILQNHYPEVPNLGDITKIDWSPYVGSADIVVGGSPCQSFSVAGSRTGLAGASGLMWEYVRAVRAIRPQWFVWENVPGALSSSHGEDFRCLLESMDDLGYGLAWRVLDAQFFGVAQRRRRVFLVGHLGDQRAAEVLFERESVQWDSASSREKRQALAKGTQGRARTAVTQYGQELAGTLTARFDSSPCVDRGQNILTTAFDYNAGNIIGRKSENGGHQLGVVDPDEDGAFTLTATDRHAVAFAQNQRDEVRILDGVAGALAARPGVKQQTFVAEFSEECEDMSPTLTSHDSKDPNIVYGGSSVLRMRSGCAGGGKGALVSVELSLTLATGNDQTLFSGSKVRRLTPLECERLQGFPDGWTDIPYRGKPYSSDSARYKALGNSMAVPVMRWLGRRIKKVES